MTDANRRRMDKLDRERVFLTDNVADFRENTAVNNLSTTIDDKTAGALQYDAALVSALGDKAQAMSLKGDHRDHLLDILHDIVLAARGIGNTAVAGITAKFKMPEPRTEQNLIAGAEAMFQDTAPPLEDKFIAAGLPPEFRNHILAAKDDFQTSRDEADSAAEEHGEAVAALDALMREMMALARQRSALVQLKYKDNPGKLGAWAIASHLERAPHRARKVLPESS